VRNDTIKDVTYMDKDGASEIHDHDHKGMNPHAHDSNGSYGKARPLTKDEQIAYDEFKNFDVEDGKVTDRK